VCGGPDHAFGFAKRIVRRPLLRKAGYIVESSLAGTKSVIVFYCLLFLTATKAT
jgi:hypothetical protein